MQRTISRSITGGIGLLLFFCGAQYAGAATLSLTPASGTLSTIDSVSVSVIIDSEGKDVNVGEAEITFDPALLQVTNINKEGSAFNLWTVEPTFSNEKGTVTFSGGSPSPFNGKKAVIVINFKPVKPGEATVAFAKGSVLAADGKGTDVASAKNGAKYTIIEGSPEGGSAASPAEEEETSSTAPPAPLISSLVYADSNKWYKEINGDFSWNLPDDVDNIRLSIDGKPESTPPTNKTIDVTGKYQAKNLPEGHNYLHVMFHNDTGWGKVGHYEFKIDKTPPVAFTVEIKQATGTDPGLALFSATDTLSGIDHYEISVDGGSPSPVKPDQLSPEGYAIPKQIIGDHKLSVKAVDKAGNATEASGTLSFKGTEPPPLTEEEKAAAAAKGGIPWFSIGFGVLSVVLGMLLFQERRKQVHEKDQLKREADEAGESVGKIFSALHDEIEEQLKAFSKKPTLSDQERLLQEKINEALEISEDLLGEEMEDVRKLLR